jgi:hypothetical protein
MSTFDDRETAFEAKFALDADMLFRAEARRNKLTGLWAAELLGLSGEEAAEYAKSVVKADFEEAGDADVVRKLVADLDGKADEATIKVKLAEMMKQAKSQLLDGV